MPTYARPAGEDSAPGDEARQLAFAVFVRRAMAAARATRAWNGAEVARRTGVSRQTLNRWVRGDWHNDPEAERVVAFCEGLGLSSTAAFTILQWQRGRRAPEPVPSMDPDVAALFRGPSGSTDQEP